MDADLSSSPLVLVAAVDLGRRLGQRGNHPLPWHLPADLRRFKALTLGSPVLMGRHTAESIGRALPGRPNLVLTRSGRAPFAGQTAVASLGEARERSAGQSLKVIGGGEVYALALPLASAVHLTWVDAELTLADAVCFPELGPEWRETGREEHPSDAAHAHRMTFVDYQRAPPAI